MVTFDCPKCHKSLEYCECANQKKGGDRMAKRRVRISYGRTMQSAPFESIRMDIAIEKDVEDNASLMEEVGKSVNGLRQYIKMKIAETLANE